MGYSSEGLFVTVYLVDGTIYDEVIVCPDPGDRENKTLLEKYNGDVIRLWNESIDRIEK